MTETGLLIRRLGDGLRGIMPAGAATVLDAAPRLDVMVLEVAGGHLTWNVLAGPALPAAVIDDVELAQEWVWAIYGEPIALALDEANAAARTDRTAAPSPDASTSERSDAAFDDGSDPERSPIPSAPEFDGERSGIPAASEFDRERLAGRSVDSWSVGAGGAPLSELAASAWRLAFALWVSRWWPASTLDGIAALDQRLLDREIAELTLECESLLDGADAIGPEVEARVESLGRASDYALAAGDEIPNGMVLGRGVGGWDWRRCPSGLVDASEKALSWQLIRDAGVTTIAVAAATAPGLSGEVPAYLRPWARVATGGEVREVALRSSGGSWSGEITFTATGSTVHVDVYVPGFGLAPGPVSYPTAPGHAALRHHSSESELRLQIRDFASSRLGRAASSIDLPAGSDVPGVTFGGVSPDAPLLAEIAAAEDDSDF
ncbi:hypothetical protein ACFVUS_36680 [Nocardia sp. NPDC058058]|uniref:hypothetical protein n=1 Tax=Nocardia sp. NPDC058058 TaxID=3346317 RepID=UPI0036D8BC2C